MVERTIVRKMTAQGEMMTASSLLAIVDCSMLMVSTIAVLWFRVTVLVSLRCSSAIMSNCSYCWDATPIGAE